MVFLLLAQSANAVIVFNTTENLAAGTGSGYTITSAITSWTNEVCELEVL